jgi:hypothetical protein
MARWLHLPRSPRYHRDDRPFRSWCRAEGRRGHSRVPDEQGSRRPSSGRIGQDVEHPRPDPVACHLGAERIRSEEEQPRALVGPGGLGHQLLAPGTVRPLVVLRHVIPVGAGRGRHPECFTRSLHRTGWKASTAALVRYGAVRGGDPVLHREPSPTGVLPEAATPRRIIASVTGESRSDPMKAPYRTERQQCGRP